MDDNKNNNETCNQAREAATSELANYLVNELGNNRLCELASGAQSEILTLLSYVYIDDRVNVDVDNISKLFSHLNQISSMLRKTEECYS